jgi:excinuclease ABC subunit A
LKDVGLGYITLGQSATTLSGGEAQRIKLASELSKKSTGNTFYILDEPTTGLHFQDIKVLLDVIETIVDKGNSVLIIEHNLDVIKVADYIIDLGKEGGEKGGYILCEGTPEKIIKSNNSYTADFLKNEL